jgi:TPR repeat protein
MGGGGVEWGHRETLLLRLSLERAGRFEEAAYWYRQAANRDWAWSQDYLGVAYLRGQGVPVDFARAVEFLRSAAGQGNAPATNLYERTDFSVLFKDDQRRAKIIQDGLVAKGLLAATDATGTWGPATDAAFQGFKRSVQLAEEGLTLRALDKLGVVDHLSEVIGKTRCRPGRPLRNHRGRGHDRAPQAAPGASGAVV